MTKEEDFAIAFANLKAAPGKKDYVETARALHRLKSYPEYSSNEKLAKHLPVTGEMVREFLTILELPESVQRRFGPDGLKLEHGRRLWQLTRRRPNLQRDVARAMTSLKSHEARHLVEYVLDHPDLPVSEARKLVLDSATKVEREYHVIALLSESEYKALLKYARAQNLAVDAVVTAMVRSWLASRSDLGD